MGIPPPRCDGYDLSRKSRADALLVHCSLQATVIVSVCLTDR